MTMKRQAEISANLFPLVFACIFARLLLYFRSSFAVFSLVFCCIFVFFPRLLLYFLLVFCCIFVRLLLYFRSSFEVFSLVFCCIFACLLLYFRSSGKNLTIKTYFIIVINNYINTHTTIFGMYPSILSTSIPPGLLPRLSLYFPPSNRIFAVWIVREPPRRSGVLSTFLSTRFPAVAALRHFFSFKLICQLLKLSCEKSVSKVVERSKMIKYYSHKN